MINATVSGNLGRDAELRRTESGPVLSFGVASNTKERGQETTIWVDCSLWGTRAEKLAPHLTKGKRVVVAGRLGTREHNGQTYLKLSVNELDFMSDNRGQRQERREEPAGDDRGSFDEPDDSDELGF